MELDAVDRKLAMAHRHDLAVLRPRRDLELLGHRVSRQRVVAADLELVREAREEPAAVESAIELAENERR